MREGPRGKVNVSHADDCPYTTRRRDVVSLVYRSANVRDRVPLRLPFSPFSPPEALRPVVVSTRPVVLPCPPSFYLLARATDKKSQRLPLRSSMGAATSAQGGHAPRIVLDPANDELDKYAVTRGDGTVQRKAVRRGKELEAKLDLLKAGVDDLKNVIEDELKAEDEKKFRKVFDHKKKEWIVVAQDTEKNMKEKKKNLANKKKGKKGKKSIDEELAERQAPRGRDPSTIIRQTSKGVLLPEGVEVVAESNEVVASNERDWVTIANQAMKRTALYISGANAFGLSDMGGSDGKDAQKLVDSIPSQMISVFSANNSDDQTKALLSNSTKLPSLFFFLSA